MHSILRQKLIHRLFLIDKIKHSIPISRKREIDREREVRDEYRYKITRIILLPIKLHGLNPQKKSPQFQYNAQTSYYFSVSPNNQQVTHARFTPDDSLSSQLFLSLETIPLFPRWSYFSKKKKSVSLFLFTSLSTFSTLEKESHVGIFESSKFRFKLYRSFR